MVEELSFKILSEDRICSEATSTPKNNSLVRKRCVFLSWLFIIPQKYFCIFWRYGKPQRLQFRKFTRIWNGFPWKNASSTRIRKEGERRARERNNIRSVGYDEKKIIKYQNFWNGRPSVEYDYLPPSLTKYLNHKHLKGYRSYSFFVYFFRLQLTETLLSA